MLIVTSRLRTWRRITRPQSNLKETVRTTSTGCDGLCNGELDVISKGEKIAR